MWCEVLGNQSHTFLYRVSQLSLHGKLDNSLFLSGLWVYLFHVLCLPIKGYGFKLSSLLLLWRGRWISKMALWPGDGHTPSASACTESWATAAANPQHPLKGAPGGDQECGPLRAGKTGRTGLRVGIFRRRLNEPRSCISSYLGKHQNPSWWCLLLKTGRDL